MSRPPTHHIVWPVLGLMLLTGCSAPGSRDSSVQPTEPASQAANTTGLSFDHDVKPILQSKCLACHSGESAPWGFRLESRDLAFAPGSSGPRIVPGKPDQSLILSLASTHKNVAVMPVVGERLTAQESKTLRRWIVEGAHWPSGKPGALKPAPGSVRPDQAGLREEWRSWFKRDAARE